MVQAQIELVFLKSLPPTQKKTLLTCSFSCITNIKENMDQHVLVGYHTF